MQKEYKTCPVCGKEITHKGSNAQIYCSEECRRLAHNRKNKDKIVKHNKGIAEVKYRIIAAYHGECAICGWKMSSCLTASKDGKMQWAFGNQIHHIEQVNEGGKAELDNLILLCPNHHAQANAGLITKEELRKHQKPVPLPQKEVEKDLAAIEKTIEDYDVWIKEHKDGYSLSLDLRLEIAWDLAIMLGNAGLIDSYYDARQQRHFLVDDLKRDIVKMEKEIAKADTDSNIYPQQNGTFYTRCLDIA